MKTKSKAAKIREAIAAGEKPADVAKRLRVPVSTVYTTRWKMKKEGSKRVVISKAEAHVAKKLGVTYEEYAKEKLKLQQQTETQKVENNLPLEYEAYMQDLLEIRRQIDNLHTIEAFLQIRVDQMRQNAQWQAAK